MVAVADKCSTGSRREPERAAWGAGEADARRGMAEVCRQLYGTRVDEGAERVDAGLWRTSPPRRGDGEDVVLVRDIPFITCEHHLLPCHGKASVAYLAGGRVVSASHVARTVNALARRPRTPLQFAEQVADAVALQVTADAVAVVIEADHVCIEWCDAASDGSQTSALRGRFKAEPALGAEVVALLTADAAVPVSSPG